MQLCYYKLHSCVLAHRLKNSEKSADNQHQLTDTDYRQIKQLSADNQSTSAKQ